MEVASESAHERDAGFRRDPRASPGITEYWRVDPSGGDFHGYPLAGERLVDGEYQDPPLTTDTDRVVGGCSPMLDLWPCRHPAWDWDADDSSNLRFFDRKTGRYLCDARLVDERLAEEIRARTNAEERVRQLEAQSRRQQS